MDYLYIKSLHIIFVVTWFSGLFYIVRLFIYYKEAENKPEIEGAILRKQYRLMSKRLLYMITWPSAILASSFAFWMLYEDPSLLTKPWMIIKLGFVFVLYLYHYSCQLMYNQMALGEIKFSSFWLRVWNEVTTIVLFACVFLVILKDSLNWIFGVAGLVGLSILLMIGIKVYKKISHKKEL